MKNLTTYNKCLIAVASALGVAGSVLSDNVCSLSDIVAILAAFVGALAVYAVPNKGN